MVNINVIFIFRQSLRRFEGSRLLNPVGNNRQAGRLHRRCQQSRFVVVQKR